MFEACHPFGDNGDGFVAWKIKKIPTHEHKLAKKTLRDGGNGELTLEDQKRGLHSLTNIVDEDSMKTHVVDIVVHLMISRSCTRRLRTRSHVWFGDVLHALGPAGQRK
jgi:hypothetical protein